jgi:hypothetical protein
MPKITDVMYTQISRKKSPTSEMQQIPEMRMMSMNEFFTVTWKYAGQSFLTAMVVVMF